MEEFKKGRPVGESGEEAATPIRPRVSTFASLKNRNYRRFWVSMLLSFSGLMMQNLACAWLVYELTSSPFALGMVSAAWGVPMLVLAIYGGVVTDRVNKRNLLIITGEPPQVGDYPDATAVFDVDSIGLTNVVQRLNHGLDIGGQSIGHATAFHIGVAVNPGALNLDEEIRRFEYKVEAGAEFAITQPVFDVGEFSRFLTRIEGCRIPVLAAITPLESLRHAEFMANEVPGVRVPDEVIARMRQADAAGRAAAEGLAIAREIAAGVRPVVQGLQIAAMAGLYVYAKYAKLRELTADQERITG